MPQGSEVVGVRVKNLCILLFNWLKELEIKRIQNARINLQLHIRRKWATKRLNICNVCILVLNKNGIFIFYKPAFM